MDLVDDEATFGAASSDGSDSSSMLVIACGAIAKELLEVIRLNSFTHLEVECLPGKLHNVPRRIPAAVEAKLAANPDRSVFVAYADCGTGGDLDRVLARYGAERIPGAHCYEFFAGGATFAEMHDGEPATFYLTDFLCRHFDRFVIQGLKLDRHPELKSQIFANYRRLVYLAQTDDAALVEKGQEAATYLGLEYEVVRTGYGDLQRTLVDVVTQSRAGSTRTARAG